MSKIFLSLILLLVSSISSFAQKTVNDENAQKRSIGSFHGVEVATGVTLIIMEGNVEELAVSASSPEFRDNIITKIENGILKIYYDNKLKSPNSKRTKKDLKAYVSYKKLDYLEATTGAEVQINGVMKSTFLKMNASTGAFINGQVNIKELKVKQSTGSEIAINGTAEKLEVEGDTGSRFRGVDLKTTICNAKVSTGAGINVTAEKELYAKANTGGYVKYKGDAGIREVTKSTGGTVSKITN